jgi:hypothetical protein
MVMHWVYTDNMLKLLKIIEQYRWVIISFVLFLIMPSIPMWIICGIEDKLLPGFFNGLIGIVIWLFFPVIGLVCCINVRNYSGKKFILSCVMIVIHCSCIVFIFYFLLSRFW